MYKIKPLEGKVIVRRKEFKDKTSGGIYLSERAKDPRQAHIGVEAVVLRSSVNEFKEGDTVIIQRFAGQVLDSPEIIGGGKDWILSLDEDEILAKLEE
jgi:co-chaperonin GroES (HSP10)